MTNDIRELRSILFDTLREAKDTSKKLDVERCKVVAELSQVLINTAKAEVDFLRVVGGKSTGFLEAPGVTTNVSAGGKLK